jgi:hypothetical protein
MQNSSEKGRKNTQQWQRTVQSKWLVDFSWLLLDSDIVSYCNIYRKYFDLADRKSLMFIGKIVDRMDIYLPMETQLKRFDG